MTEPKKIMNLAATPKPGRIDEHQLGDWQRSIERKKRGRKRTKRTAQIHPRMYPEIAEEMTDLADQKDVTIGEFVEEIFAYWKSKKR